VYIFGVVDVSCSPDRLYAYGYREDDGGKGGNNVASLLMQALHDLGWLVRGTPGKRLSIIMDNCSGQNKNKHVLRLALWLVELSYFQQVEFIFYVRGHTKNVCDRMFNLLKIRYRSSNVYTMNQLSAAMNSVEQVTFKQVTSDGFFNYDEMLNTYYKVCIVFSIYTTFFVVY
jgi:hypothetical protein